MRSRHFPPTRSRISGTSSPPARRCRAPRKRTAARSRPDRLTRSAINRLGRFLVIAGSEHPATVIPGRCQRVRARRGPMTGSASNPESRDSGSGADAPSRNDASDASRNDDLRTHRLCGAKSMSAMLLAQQVLNGLLDGVYYLLIALGLSLIFSLGGIVNLAHGAFYAIGAYLTLVLSPYLGFGGSFV